MIKKFILLVVMILLLTSCKSITMQTEKTQDTAFYLDSLYDIGEFSASEDDKRFYNEPVYDFIPSDEYGKIIPYIGSYRVFHTSNDDAFSVEQGYCTYGFCTPDGRIVMDASDKNTYINYRTTNDGFGFYTLTREMQPKDDAPDEFTSSEVLVIDDKGSWCISLDGSSWVSGAGGGYINVCRYRDDGSTQTLLYDYYGNLVKTIDGTDGVGTYSHGLLLVSSWTNNGYSAVFVNENGQKVLGPYSAASDFNEYGICAVEDEKGAYLINAKGEILSDYYDAFFKEYSNDMTKQVFVGRYKNNNKISDVFSADAELLGTAFGATYMSFRFPENEKIYYYYTKFDNDDKGNTIYNSEKMIWKSLEDQSDFVSKEHGTSPNSYSGTDNCFVYIDKENKVGYVLDPDGETIAVLDGASDVINTSEKGEYILYIEGEYDYSFNEETGKPNEDTRKTHIYDSKNKQIIYTAQQAGANAYFVGEDKRFIMISVFDADDFFGGVSTNSLYDTHAGEMILQDCTNISLNTIDGKTYINACTKNSSALYDEDMNVIRKSYFE